MLSNPENFLGRAKEFIAKTFGGVPTSPDLVEPPTTQEHPVLLGDPKTTVFKPAYGIEDVLNTRQRDDETKALVQELKRNQDEMLKASKTHPSPKDGQTFLASEKKFISMRDYVVGLQEDYAKLMDGSQPFYSSYLIRQQILGVTAEIIMHENLTRLSQLTDKYSMGFAAKNYYSIQEALFASCIGVKFGDLALVDFLDKDVASKFTPNQIFEFFLRAKDVRAKKKHGEILEANRGSNPLTKYPNFFKGQVDIAAAMVESLTNSSPLDFDDQIGTYGDNKEVTERARRLVEHADRVKQNIYKTLLDPTSPHFPALQKTLAYYITGDREVSVPALNIAGLKEITHIYELYRKTRYYAKEGIFPDFYADLAEAIKKYAEEVKAAEEVLTEDDLITIIDQKKEPAPSDSVPTTDEFSKLIGQIFSRTQVQDYQIDVQSINWHQMKPPHNATLSFHPNTPKRFAVQFDYISKDTGETLSLTFGGDLRKNLLDWSFIEEPTDTPEFSDFRNSLLFITQSILLETQKQTQREFEQKQKDRLKTPTVTTQLSKKPEQRQPTPNMPKRTDVVKEIKAEQARALSDQESAHTEQLLRKEIKKHLIIPPAEEQAKLMQHLSYEDQARVFQEISKYNTTQLGKFLPKRGRGPNGEILWALDVSSKVPGRIRVLATEYESEVGKQDFIILDIDYRKDIYDNWGI